MKYFLEFEVCDFELDFAGGDALIFIGLNVGKSSVFLWSILSLMNEPDFNGLINEEDLCIIPIL